MVASVDTIKFFCPACGQRIAAPQTDAGKEVFCPSCRSGFEIPKASQSMRTVRIFISSPGDVAEERDRARQVIESLRRRYVGHFGLRALLWEDLPLQPDMSFQEGIDQVIGMDESVDIAVFVLWSRLGSPVGAVIRKPDGSTYRSGTEREFDLMMAVRAQSGGVKPDILIYTRHDDSSFFERLRGKPTEETEKLVNQKLQVEKFITETFKDSDTGTNIGAYHTFDRPVTFTQRLRTHLMTLLDRLAGDSWAENVWDVEANGSPFMGLDPFQPGHAAVFYGREEQTLEARQALRQQARQGCAFLLLSGASGCGKSSLARAGILPSIVENELDAQIVSWRFVVLTPTELAPDLIGSLVRRLAAPEVLPEIEGSGTVVDEIASGLRHASELTVPLLVKPAFERARKTAGGGVRLLVVLDQLEELFTAADVTPEDRRAFLEVIERLARSGYVWVLATARADFHPLLQTEPALVRMKSGSGQMDVLPPDADGLRRLVEEPARLAGLKFERRDGVSLSNVILRDAVAHAELLPLVEFVLRELFEQRTPDGLMTYAAYDALGGVEGALARRAEQVFAGLPPSAQAALETVLQTMVTSGQGDNADDDTLVRQRAPLSIFSNNPAAGVLLDTFVNQRLFKADSNPHTGEPSVTVAHEALLRVWDRAAKWAEQNRDFLRVRSHVAQRMATNSPLLEGDPLTEAARLHLNRSLDGFTSAQRSFVTDCLLKIKEQERNRKTMRQRSLLTQAALIVVAVMAGTFAFNNYRESKTSQDRAAQAQREKEIAINRAATAESKLSKAGISWHQSKERTGSEKPVGAPLEALPLESASTVKRIGQELIEEARGAGMEKKFEKAQAKLKEARDLLDKTASKGSQEYVETLADILVEQSRIQRTNEEVVVIAKANLKEVRERATEWDPTWQTKSWRLELATIRLQNNSQIGNTDNRDAFKSLADRIRPLVAKSQFAFEAIYACYVTTGNIYRTSFRPVPEDYDGLRDAAAQLRKHLKSTTKLSRTELEILGKMVGRDVEFVIGMVTNPQTPHYSDTIEPRRALLTEFEAVLQAIEKTLGTPSSVLLTAQNSLGKLQMEGVREGFHTHTVEELKKAENKRQKMEQELGSAKGVANTLVKALSNVSVDGTREEYVTELNTSIESFQKLGIRDMTEILADTEVSNAVDQARTQKDKILDSYLNAFLNGDVDDRTLSLAGFTRNMSVEMQRWLSAKDYSKFVSLWDRGLKTLPLESFVEGERDTFLTALQGCSVALLKSSRTADARRPVAAAESVADTILRKQPWDWYLRNSYMDFCFIVAEALSERQQEADSQRLLRTAWALSAEFWGLSPDAARHYTVLPLKGRLPDSMRPADAALFDRYLPEGMSRAATGSMKRFTATWADPVSHKDYPYSLYVTSGRNGFENYKQQVTWLEKRRGIIVNPQITSAFKQLFDTAQSENKDFAEVCAEALAKKE